MPRGGNYSKPVAKQAEEKALEFKAVWICVHKAILKAKHKARSRWCHVQNREKNLVRMRAAHHERGQEVNRTAGRKFRQKNKEKIKRENKEKYDSDPVYRMGFILRGRVRWAIHAALVGKAGPSFDLLGCNARDYAAYLGVDALTNYRDDELHVDHIWPIAMYNLADPADHYRAFNYRNTRLCTKAENLAKGSTPPSLELALTVPLHLWPVKGMEYYDV